MLRTVAQRTNVLAQTAVPIGIPSSGTVAANGAITLTTALQQTYSSIWLSFPAGALFAGSAAGQYFCQMTSPTAGTAYNIRLIAPAVPFLPTAAQLTAGAIVAAGPGAYTQTIGSSNFFSIVVPGGSMGPNGRVEYTWEWSIPNNVNTKSITTDFGGIGVTTGLTTTNVARYTTILTNRGAQNVNYQSNVSQDGASGAGSRATTTVDTSANVTFAWRGNLAVDTDYVVIEAFSIKVFFSP